MTDPVRKVLVGSVFFALTCLAAVIGYTMAGWTLLEAIYMVVITIFGVGYGEVRPIDDPGLKVFTIVVIIAGCTSAIYVVGGFVQMIAEGEFNKVLGARRMCREIDALQKHVVVCGFGRVGRIVTRDLHAAGVPFVVVEANLAAVEEAQRLGYLVRAGDASDENVLRSVGVDRARLLATVLSDDAQNVFVTLSARDLNPGIEIIARGESPSTERKLLHSGASRVVLPAAIGASMIARLITNPPTEERLAAEFFGGRLDEELRDIGLGVTLHEVEPGAPIAGKTVGRIGVTAIGGCVIVAIRTPTGEIIRNPALEQVVDPGSTLVLLSHAEHPPNLTAHTDTDHAILYRGARITG